ncbi:MAG: ABC transporter permease [Chloroflexi bacterium]|nr:ABC transporter permease [Chloroflexota bacterium]
MLLLLYAFLHLPILYIVYVSFQTEPVFPFPPDFTLEHYQGLLAQRDFHTGLLNSLTIGLGTGTLSATLATLAAVGVLKYRSPGRKLTTVLLLAPLFVAHVLIGISSLLFYRSVLGLPGTLSTAILANTTYGLAFAFLVVLAQIARYDWRMDDAAMVFGASPLRAFREVTLPIIWPAVFGAFLVTFILAFNNLEISFYNLGAIPTLPTIAWGSLRHGIKPELYALAAVVNAAVFGVLFVLYALMKLGVVRLGPPEE